MFQRRKVTKARKSSIGWECIISHLPITYIDSKRLSYKKEISSDQFRSNSGCGGGGMYSGSSLMEMCRSNFGNSIHSQKHPIQKQTIEQCHWPWNTWSHVFNGENPAKKRDISAIHKCEGGDQILYQRSFRSIRLFCWKLTKSQVSNNNKMDITRSFGLKKHPIWASHLYLRPKWKNAPWIQSCTELLWLMLYRRFGK